MIVSEITLSELDKPNPDEDSEHTIDKPESD